MFLVNYCRNMSPGATLWIADMFLDNNGAVWDRRIRCIKLWIQRLLVLVFSWDLLTIRIQEMENIAAHAFLKVAI